MFNQMLNKFNDYYEFMNNTNNTHTHTHTYAHTHAHPNINTNRINRNLTQRTVPGTIGPVPRSGGGGGFSQEESNSGSNTEEETPFVGPVQPIEEVTTPLVSLSLALSPPHFSKDKNMLYAWGAVAAACVFCLIIIIAIVLYFVLGNYQIAPKSTTTTTYFTA